MLSSQKPALPIENVDLNFHLGKYQTGHVELLQQNLASRAKVFHQA